MKAVGKGKDGCGCFFHGGKSFDNAIHVKFDGNNRLKSKKKNEWSHQHRGFAFVH